MARAQSPVLLANPPTVAGHATRKDYVDVRAVPVGGTVGQVLAKNSALDRDVGWIDPPAGSGGGGGITTLRAATDYDNTTAPTDGQSIVWSGSSGKFRPLSLTAALVGAAALSHTHSASDITSGVLAIAQIPTGTSSTTVALGNDSRFTDSRAPSGTAGGSLSGTYPSPTLAAGAVGSSEIAAAVKDPAGGTAGLRTLGTGAQQAAAGNDGRLSDARPPLAHNHAASEVTSGTFAIGRIPTGTSSTTVPLGNDSRFSDARTPTAHATSHLGGGSDPIAALVPAGGTNGQVLAKSSSSDYALSWTTPSSGSGTTINGTGYVTGTVAAGSTTPTITHNLGTRAVTVAVQEASTGLIVPVAVETTDSGGTLSVNHVRLSFGTAPTSNQYTYVIFAGAPVQAQVVPVPPVTLTDAATIATDASLSTHFRLAAMAGSRTLGIPTNPVDGQRALWEITASAADRVLTFTTGSTDAFETSTMVPTNTLTIPSGKTGIVGALYSVARRRWTLLAAAVTV